MSDLTLFPKPTRRRYAGKPGEGPVTIEVGRRTCWLHGNGIPHLLNRAGIDRRMYDHRWKAWSIPANRVWDVLPVAERQLHREVQIVEVDR